MDFLSIICPRQLIPFRAPQASVSPISLIIRNHLHSASMPFPEFQWGRYKQMLIREGRAGETREKQSGAALGQGPVSPPKDTHNNAFKLWYPFHKQADPRPVGPKVWWWWLLPTSPPTLQKNTHRMTIPSLNIYYKTYYFPKWEYIVSRAGAHCLPAFAWQSTKAILFYFTENSVSEIWFGTSVQRSWAISITTCMAPYNKHCTFLPNNTGSAD